MQCTRRAACLPPYGETAAVATWAWAFLPASGLGNGAKIGPVYQEHVAREAVRRRVALHLRAVACDRVDRNDQDLMCTCCGGELSIRGSRWHDCCRGELQPVRQRGRDQRQADPRGHLAHGLPKLIGLDSL